MTWLLIKKQLYELFRGFFVDQRKNRSRSRTSTVLFIAGYRALMVFLALSLFGVLALALSEVIGMGLGWYYYDYMTLLAVLMGTVGSVFTTYSMLYLGKDNSLLLSMPIPVGKIVVSRLAAVYMMGLMYSACASIPAVAVYLHTAGFTIRGLLGGLVWIFNVSVIVLILSCLLGYIVAKYSIKMKRKSYVTVLLALGFFVLYYLGVYRINAVMTRAVMNAMVYGEKIKGSAHPVYMLGRSSEGDLISMLCIVAVLAAFCALLWKVLNTSFLGIATATGKQDFVKYDRTRASRARSPERALMGKELARFTSSAGYMLNCGLGSVFMLVLAAVLFLKGRQFSRVLTSMVELPSGAMAVIITGSLWGMAGMGTVSAPSVSLEGRSLWIIRSLPVSEKRILKAKLGFHCMFYLFPLLAVCAGAVWAFRLDPPTALLMTASSVGYMTLLGAAGLVFGLLRPDFEWTNEMYPIKQGMSVMVTVLGSMVLSVALIGIYFLAMRKISPILYLALAAIVVGILLTAALRWLFTKGCDIFRRL
ncbi:MAG: hypothetical protein K5911_02065 [Eubacteriales bacterium]|nr:hypothetical protein [Eubacteriales bacterium]